MLRLQWPSWRWKKYVKCFDKAANIQLEDGSKQMCHLKQSCMPTGARKYLTTITDVLILNYAVSIDEARDGTQKKYPGRVAL